MPEARTSGAKPVARRVRAASQEAGREAAPWIDRLAKFGYAAKGVVYSLIGLLALLAAIGAAGGRLADTRGVMEALEGMSLGTSMLALLALGLAGYAVWRIAQAAADPDRKGRDWKGILTRIGYAGSGIVYAGIAVTAARLAFGGESSGGGKSKQSWAAELLSEPLGEWLLAGAGAGFLGFAGYQLYKAWSASFAEDWKREEMSNRLYRTGVALGRAGETARGVVFGIVGIFLLVTAWQSDPAYTKGMDGALAELADKPYGSWLLGATAVGLLAYGFLMFFYAGYRRLIRDRAGTGKHLVREEESDRPPQVR